MAAFPLARRITPSQLAQLCLISACLFLLYHYPLITSSSPFFSTPSSLSPSLPPPPNRYTPNRKGKNAGAAVPAAIVQKFQPPSRQGQYPAQGGHGGAKGDLHEKLHHWVPPTCEVCKPDELLCDALGDHNVQRSVTSSGSNARLRRFLHKLRSGKPVKVSVLGGSVSLGQNIPNSEQSPDIMHRRIYKHLIEKFPHAEHELTIGAAYATGSSYFKFCFMEHIPIDSDLILVELAVNDQYNSFAAKDYEKLLRGLLDLPSRPAVVDIESFGLAYDAISNGGDMHLPISIFYDVPTISIRAALLPSIMARPQTARAWFTNPNTPENVDYRHISLDAHRLTARLVNTYFDRQLCEMNRLDTTADEKVPWESLSKEADRIPPMMLTDRWDENRVLGRPSPQCQSMKSKHHPLRLPAGQTGWEEWSSSPAKHYIRSTTPGSKISFPFKTHSSPSGELFVSYLRSATFGLGQVSCAIDDADQAVVMDGYWTDESINIAFTTMVSNTLEPGDHKLHCTLLGTTNDPQGRTEFRFISLMSM